MRYAMAMLTRLHRAAMRAAATLLFLLIAWPAQAAVTITFWSHEFGNSFPHAFITLRGVPDAGGGPVDANYGFTARTVSPAILFGAVPGRIDTAKPAYMAGSDAQFSLEITDAQYADVLRLVDEWSEATGNATYLMNSRNCVHFTQEAARRVGLTTLDFPKLMKKPRSFLQAVAAANAGQVTVLDRRGAEYLAGLEPLPAPGTPPPPAPPVTPPPAVHVAPQAPGGAALTPATAGGSTVH